MKTLTSACQYLMSVGLMTYVPYQLVIRRVKHIMQSYGQLHGTQRRTQVTGVLTQLLNNKIAHFLAHLWQCLAGQRLQVARVVNRIEVFILHINPNVHI